MPANEPYFTLLAWIMTKIAYSSMLFILEIPIVQATSRINSMFKYATVCFTRENLRARFSLHGTGYNSVSNGASIVVNGSYDGAWYTHHSHMSFVVVSQIWMRIDQFAVHQTNICHSCRARRVRLALHK